MKQRALRILWPAFIGAGVLDAMVFAVVDPGDLRWFGGEPLGWTAPAIYTVTFIIFWIATATSSAMTSLLSLQAEEVNQLDVEAGHVLHARHGPMFDTSARREP